MNKNCIITATFIIGIILLIWCITKQSPTKETYISFRDEHDDVREEDDRLLREDDLWNASVRDNIYDPQNIMSIPGPQTITHGDDYLDKAMDSYLMQPDASDYMGRFLYDKDHIYRGKVMEYPSTQIGGYYLSPTYEMPVEDQHELLTQGINYYNVDHLSPIKSQLQLESYDNIGGDITLSDKEYMEDYGRAHVGLARDDGHHAYMHINVAGQGADAHLAEASSGYSHQGDDFYDEEDYNNGGPGGTGPRELRNMPIHPSGMSAINMMGGQIEKDFLREAEANWYNVTNMGYNLDMDEGAYGRPLSSEMNTYDPKQVDRLRYERLGNLDVSNAVYNHDFTYEYGSESFLNGQDTQNYPTNYDPAFFAERYPDPPLFPGEKEMLYESLIEDVPLFPPDRDRNLIPWENKLWKMKILPDHTPLVGADG